MNHTKVNFNILMNITKLENFWRTLGYDSADLTWRKYPGLLNLRKVSWIGGANARSWGFFSSLFPGLKWHFKRRMKGALQNVGRISAHPHRRLYLYSSKLLLPFQGGTKASSNVPILGTLSRDLEHGTLVWRINTIPWQWSLDRSMRVWRAFEASRGRGPIKISFQSKTVTARRNGERIRWKGGF